MIEILQFIALFAIITGIFIFGYHKGKNERDRRCKYSNLTRVYREDKKEYELDDDTIPDPSGFTTYYENRYGESDDFMTGNIPKSSITVTNRDKQHN